MGGRRIAMVAVLVGTGCGRGSERLEPAWEAPPPALPGWADCSPGPQGQALPEGAQVRMACADRQARLHPSGNFASMREYFGAVLGGGRDEGWALLSRGFDAWQVEATGAAPAYQTTELGVVATGRDRDGNGMQFDLSGAPNVATGLRCATVWAASRVHELACYAVGEGARGLCDRFAYPADPVAKPGPRYRVALPASADERRAFQVVSRLRASPDLIAIDEVGLDDGRAWSVAFRDTTSFEAIHDTITLRWCALGEDVRVHAEPTSREQT